MLDAPPREREWLSWTFAGAWTLVVYATIPVARRIQEAVSGSVGRDAFAVAVLAAIAAAAVVTVRAARRRPPGARASPLWLGLVGATFVGCTLALRAAPEEALHFVEYGVLGALLYRALVHRLRDTGVYAAAALLGASAGILDEAIQWIAPERVWDLRDVRLNAFAGVLVQLGIGLGLRPLLVSGRPGPRSVRWICRSGAAAVLLLGLSLLNTPSRIAWYAERVPGLGFLLENESVMLEYGHRIEDPATGRFFSRFAPDELRRIDAARAAEAAAVLDRYPDREAYLRFLQRYTPATDPFLHEVRVHLFRRDRYLRNFRALRDTDDGPDHATVAWHEQRILEEYFPETLRRSRYALAPELRAELDAHRRRDADYESAVSRGLVTGVGEGAVTAGLVALLAMLVAADRLWGRERASR